MKKTWQRDKAKRAWKQVLLERNPWHPSNVMFHLIALIVIGFAIYSPFVLFGDNPRKAIVFIAMTVFGGVSSLIARNADQKRDYMEFERPQELQNLTKTMEL